MQDSKKWNEQIWNVIDTYMRDHPHFLVQHHIDSYDDFYRKGIYKIFRERNPLTLNSEFDEKLQVYRHQCKMYVGGKSGDRVYFGKPTLFENGEMRYMYPNEARLRNMDYSMTIHYDMDVEYLNVIDENAPPAPPAPLQQEEYPVVNARTSADKSKRERTQILELGAAAPVAPPAPQTVFISGFRFQVSPVDELKKIYLGKFPIMIQSHFCVLNGLPKEIRHEWGECRNEMGGYFIISGKEKTVITQEKFADNMLYVHANGKDDPYSFSAEIRSVSENVAKPIRTLSVRIMKPSTTYSFENIVVAVPNVARPVPLFILFRALGVLADRDIIEICLMDMEKYENLIPLFIPSVHDASVVFDQQQALFFISQLLVKHKTIPKTLEILADYFLPHIGELNFKEKAYFLGYMVQRLIFVSEKIELPTDRDNYKMKRMETTGALISDLFCEYYDIQIRRILTFFRGQVNLYSKGIYENNLPKLIHDRYEQTFQENKWVEDGFKKAFRGNWGAQTFTKRVGVIQDLNRLSFLTAMTHLRKTNIPMDESVKIVGPRLLHNTQWGYLCPIDTPDGSHIGIHKHLSMLCHITSGFSREPMIQWLRLHVDMRLVTDCNHTMLQKMTKIFINGYWAGVVRDPFFTVSEIKLYRRNGLIPLYLSVAFDIRQSTIFIYTDAGRLTRPLFYIQNASYTKSEPILSLERTPANATWEQMVFGFVPKQREVLSKGIDFFDWEDLFTFQNKSDLISKNQSTIEYLDTNETENSVICKNVDSWHNSAAGQTTHCEIHEALIFSAMFNLIAFPEHNPQQRDLFSCGQSAQAVSTYHSQYRFRMDKSAILLNSPHIPLVKSRFLKHLTNEENLYGQNIVVAIMSYTGYNVEDSIIFNQAAVDRGMFKTTYYSTYQTFEEKSIVGGNDNMVVEKTFTNILKEDRVVIGTKPGYDYSLLDDRGIIRENTPVHDKVIMIGLTSNDLDHPNRRIDQSVSCKKGQLGVVDKTFVTEDAEGHRVAKVRIREERSPALGDKMASRIGQKGTAGLILPELDMPYTASGLRPDIIINPHALPSRMTIGQLMECLLSKSCVMTGAFGDCTAFNYENINKVKMFGEHLNALGYHSSGNEIMYNGMTGEQIQMEIFMGPTYYMRLKHMVKDKINYRALGPMTQLTKQPVSGRANDGGLRIGEMERDALAGHGISYFLNESMMERSDKYKMSICGQSGLPAVVNSSKSLFLSPAIDGPLTFNVQSSELRLETHPVHGKTFSQVSIPYSMKLFMQELQSMCIQMRIITNTTTPSLLDTAVAVPEKTKSSSKKSKQKGGGDDDSDDEISLASSEKEEPKKDTDDSRSLALFASQTRESRSDSRLAPSSDKSDTDDNKPVKKDTDNKPEKKDTNNKSDTDEKPREKKVTFEDEISVMKKDEYLKPEETTGGSSKSANSFHEGDEVFLRGSVDKPNRLWTVTKLGNKFVTIETSDTENLMDSDKIKVVSPLEIYSAADGFHGSNPRDDNTTQLPPSPTSPQAPQINIKVVNGPDNSIETNTGKQGTAAAPLPSTQECPVDSDMDIVDFNNLVINKLDTK
jgi:DNA-directed RNA polymerase II subunit RPB2